MIRTDGRHERTPLDLYRALEAEFGFEVDAAGTLRNHLAPQFCSANMTEHGLQGCIGNGLLEDWGPPGSIVWCNPPWGRLNQWVGRAVEQAAERQVVLLLPVRTEREWFRLLLDHACEIRWLYPRVNYGPADGSPASSSRATGGSMVAVLDHLVASPSPRPFHCGWTWLPESGDLLSPA